MIDIVELKSRGRIKKVYEDLLCKVLEMIKQELSNIKAGTRRTQGLKFLGRKFYINQRFLKFSYNWWVNKNLK